MPLDHTPINVMAWALSPSNIILHPLHILYSIMLPREPALVWEDLSAGNQKMKNEERINCLVSWV